MLVVRRKQEKKTPREDRVESSAKKCGILYSFTNHRYVWEITPEGLYERGSRIDRKNLQSFGD